ncbi:hypothetical protein C2E23DRAFT_903077 [Lenzites betulinus]|nr:hypothetical protein C2E23DRAFT_903077 [Lenzites betulinus]
MESSMYQDALETTSQHPCSFSVETLTAVAVVLPAPGTSLDRPAIPLDPDFLAPHGGIPEGLQTIQRLTLRKRATSPYQIRLSRTTERMRAPRSPLSGPPEVEKQPTTPDIIEILSHSKDSVALPNGPYLSACSFQRLPSQTPEGPWLAPNRPSTSLQPDGHQDQTFGRHTLSTLDTWSEICEDLCRAMEVFTVLSEVASAKYFAPDHPSSLLSTTSLETLPNDDGYVLDAYWRPTGPWNSFVYPVSDCIAG